MYVGPNRGLAIAIQLSVYFELGHVLYICPMHLNRNSGIGEPVNLVSTRYLFDNPISTSDLEYWNFYVINIKKFSHFYYNHNRLYIRAYV
jgi:hypothetical protein